MWVYISFMAYKPRGGGEGLSGRATNKRTFFAASPREAGFFFNGSAIRALIPPPPPSLMAVRTLQSDIFLKLFFSLMARPLPPSPP